MTISSRTPEGDPNQCPVCGHDDRIEPSLGTRDAPCPCCGHLLWFPERTAYARDNRMVIDLAKAAKEARNPTEAAEHLLGFTLAKVFTTRYGPPPDRIKLVLDRMPLAKLAKFSWGGLGLVRGWDDVVTMLESIPD